MINLKPIMKSDSKPSKETYSMRGWYDTIMDQFGQPIKVGIYVGLGHFALNSIIEAGNKMKPVHYYIVGAVFLGIPTFIYLYRLASFSFVGRRKDPVVAKLDKAIEQSIERQKPVERQSEKAYERPIERPVQKPMERQQPSSSDMISKSIALRIENHLKSHNLMAVSSHDIKELSDQLGTKMDQITKALEDHFTEYVVTHNSKRNFQIYSHRKDLEMVFLKENPEFIAIEKIEKRSPVMA